MNPNILIRPASEEDKAYVLDTFWRSCKPSTLYTEKLHPRILTTLFEPLYTLWGTDIAYHKDEPSTILGWINYSNRNIGWCYVREIFRLRGIGTTLLQQAGLFRDPEKIIRMAFWPSKKIYDIFYRKGYEIQYRPYLPLEAVDPIKEISNEV